MVSAFRVLATAATLSVAAAAYTPLIIGGEDAQNGQFPEIVSIQYEKQHVCGGTLIDRNWVLTAAHCVYEVNPAGISVVAGSVDYTGGGLGVRIEADGYLVHENYDDKNFFSHDIALVRLVDAMPLTPAIQLAALQNEEIAGGQLAVVVGWGRTSTDSALSQTLQYAYLDLIDRKKCRKIYAGYAPVHDDQICAGLPAGGKGQCKGDSGGPLFVHGIQYGIVSWSKKPCASPGAPGVFASIPKHIDWIRRVTSLPFV